MQIRLQNDFHNTVAAIRPKWDGQRWVITHRQVLNARRKLCGVQGCTCSQDELGSRPSRFDLWPVDDEQQLWVIEKREVA